MSTGEGTGTDFATMRGRDYPSIRQFTVFLENRVGQLMDVVRRFEGSNVRIVALTISDSTECALVRFLLSDPEQALRQGYMGKGFALSPEDAALIVSINARSLPELAQQVVQTLGA